MGIYFLSENMTWMGTYNKKKNQDVTRNVIPDRYISSKDMPTSSLKLDHICSSKNVLKTTKHPTLTSLEDTNIWLEFIR